MTAFSPATSFNIDQFMPNSSFGQVSKKIVDNDAVSVVMYGTNDTKNETFSYSETTVETPIVEDARVETSTRAKLEALKMAITTICLSTGAAILGFISLAVYFSYGVYFVHPFLSLMLLIGGVFLFASTALALKAR